MYELINRYANPGLEPEISELSYHALPHDKKLKYRRKEYSSSSSDSSQPYQSHGYLGETYPNNHDYNNYHHKEDIPQANDYGGGSQESWPDHSSSSSSDSSSYDSGSSSSDSGGCDGGGGE